MTPSLRAVSLGLACLAGTLSVSALHAQSTDADVARLTAAVLGDSPMLRDLEVLTDRFGGRATGSEANRAAVAWALARFREAGIDARTEPFTMPGLWLERAASATVKGEGVAFSPRVAALPFSMGYTADSRQPPTNLPRFHFVAGELELGFETTTRAMHERVLGWKANSDLTIYKSGHDSLMWQLALAKHLPEVFPAL